MLLFLNFRRDPIILLCVRQQCQSVTFALLFNGRDVLQIEAAHVKEGSRFHALVVVTDVVEQDIPVDIGEHDVELSECRNLFGSSEGDLDIVRVVKARCCKPIRRCRWQRRVRLLSCGQVWRARLSRNPCRAVPCRSGPA